MAAWSSMFSKSCPKKGQLPTPVTGKRTQQRDAARMVLGVIFKNGKIILGFVAKQRCEIALRDVIADDLVTKKCAAMKKHSLRWRHLVSVDNPTRHGTLLLEVGTRNSGGTVRLLAPSKAGIAPCSVGDDFLNSCRTRVASDASLTLCLCQKDQDSSLLARSRSLGPFQQMDGTSLVGLTDELVWRTEN